MRPVIQAFAIGLVGVAAFHLLALPLPWLLGPIAACLLAALAGVRLGGLTPLNDGMRTILGVAVGATLTPAVVATFPAMWTTLVLVPVMTVLIGLAGVPYFRRVCRYDPATAYYAAMPGGLQDMLAFGQQAGGDVRTLSLIHATRVMVIVVALPVLLSTIWDTDLMKPPGRPVADVPVHEMALMAAAALGGWWAAKRVGLFGASILGPMIAAAILTQADLLHFRPPAAAIQAAQFFIGMTVGAKYSGITMQEVRRDILAGLGFCAILIVLTVVFVEGILMAGLASGRDALLAFAPGGQAELTVLALVAGADVAYVVAHHVVRLVTVILGAPIAAKFLAPPPRPPKPPTLPPPD